MILKILLGTPLLLILQITRAQNTFDLRQAKSHYLEFSGKKFSGQEKIPFKAIEVIDFRYDTTKIGYIKQSGYAKIVFPESSSASLTRILNSCYSINLKPDSEKTLIILIKSLWLQEGYLEMSPEDKIKHGTESNIGTCVADIEAFSLTDSLLQPLIKIKDVFMYAPFNFKHLEDFLLLPFDSLVRKTASMNVGEVLQNRRPMSAETVRAAAMRRYDYPILREIPQKGVFLSFEAFKQNKPEYAEFAIKESKLTDELYIQNGNDEQLLTDYWGFFNGTDLYLKLGFSFFKMIRQNNSWDVFGSKFVQIKYNNNGFNSGGININSNSQRSKVVAKPLQLNMETGKPY